MDLAKYVNNSLFISVCILRDLPQQKNPRVLCWGSSLNYICSHVPMEIFGFYEMRKKGGNKKRVVYVKGVPILVRSSEVWEHPRAHTL